MLQPVMEKDPQATLDYAIDWSQWLGSDTISTSTWTVPSGISKASDTHTTTVVTIWLTGGTAGASYTLTNEITTAGGRTDDRSIQITMVDK